MTDDHSGKEIYTVYTCQNDTPTCTLSGWSRSGYTSMGNGRFLYQGSGGAIYSIFGTYTISPDGTSLICGSYYFTYEKDENFTEIGFYHNTSVQWEKAVSEELDISREDFWKMQENLQKQTENIEMIPFSSYVFAGKIADAENTAEPPVYALFVEDGDSDALAYDEFIGRYR